MKIKWLGHASFLITTASGKKLLIDPFNASVGYETFKGEADLVTISHHHHDHDYTDEVKGTPVIIDWPGEFTEAGINFKGISSFHDKNSGANRGKNILFVFDIDGYKLCHLGDLGYELSREEITQIGPVDVLMIPVGGYYTIDAQEAARICKAISSHYIIPMHYKTSASENLPIGTVDAFVELMGGGEVIGKNEIELQGKLEGENLVKILDYK